MSTQLSTGRVATILGVSRQHVVDMCERGDLAYAWVGKHRRIPSSSVEGFMQQPMTREEERALWLHRAVLGELAVDPDGVIVAALENVRRWMGSHRADGMTVSYLRQWEEILHQGPDVVAETLVGTLPSQRELRQNSPFAGVLADERRRQVLAAFKKHWESVDHTAAA